MSSFFSRRIIATIFVLILLVVGLLVLVNIQKNKLPPEDVVSDVVDSYPIKKVIGKSVQGRDIESYTYGKGEKHLAFVGGIHGGYEWNSVVLAYEFMDYFKENPEIIPNDVSVTVIPSANPDGVYKIIGKEGRFSVADVPPVADQSAGRFNANNVDLNRNFDCKWKPEGTWRSKKVSAGTEAFSEPESKAIQGFVLENKPQAVIFWHSQANSVYASECEAGILPETLDIMNAYSFSSGYTPVKSFDQYEVNGDVEGWLASIGIPAITVELKTHETIEWEKNLAGVKAILGYYSLK